ncbi:MAG TPA: MBL fold metallo-hydrolase [Caulobacteraceae bacterium]|nr:MBL fold metallo-hydrolase [Caulobacteraceae bacterium]
MTPSLTFHGAAGCVTGFCARLTTDKANLLIDCGMFQGSKTLKALNYQPFPFDAAAVDGVLLTHAHIDHSGLLPKLMKAGFKGPIWSTAGTRDLCAVMLPDAGHIQESEVEQLNRRNQRRGRETVTPIFTARDAVRCMDQFERIKLGDLVEVAPGVKARWWNAGHIVGSASIEVIVETDEGPMTLLFSGDLGPGGREFAADPQGPAGVDHLIIESTYGGRERAPMDPAGRRALLAEAMTEAREAGGPLLIPAFAVERTQELLADLLQVMEDRRDLAGDIFLDSPLAIEATDVFLRRGWNPALGRNPFEALHASERLRFLKTPQESDSLERLRGWHVILAASGMCDAGRVRRHLKRLLWRRDATVLLAGFQAAGTLGRLLQEGVTPVRIQGDEIAVRARIRSLDVYSGHADAVALTAWAEARRPVAGTVFIAHGEPDMSAALAERLAAAGLERIVRPELDESFALTRHEATPSKAPGARKLQAAAAGLDWHNERAALLGELNAALDRAPDDAARKALLATLRGLIAAP